MMVRKKIPYRTKLPVRLTLRERDLIRKETFYNPHFAKQIEPDEKGISLELTLDDIEDIQGYVAAEANHCEDPRLQRELVHLFDKFQEFLDSYDDQWDLD